MCYRYAVTAGQKTFATGIRKWSKHLTDFPTPKFETIDWIQQWRMILLDVYTHLCLTDESVRAALIATGSRPFKLHCVKPWGHVPSDPDTSTLHHTAMRADLISDILIDIRVRATSNTWTACSWLTSMRPAECGPLIGCRAPGSEINACTHGGIVIRFRHCCLEWSYGLPVTVSRCLLSTLTTIFSRPLTVSVEPPSRCE